MKKTVFVTLPLTVTQRLGKQGMKLKKLFSDLKEKTLSYMADNGHGPEDENSVQKLDGFNYVDFDHAQDLMDFLYPHESGTSLLALGSYGGAYGKTRTSYTGTVIERALTNAPHFDLLFLDILNVYVDVVLEFQEAKGGVLFKSTKCMKKQMFAVLQDAIAKVLVEICQLRLKLNKQASIVLLGLGPTVRTAWEPIIQHCLELFQSRNDLEASRLIIHDTMPFHPSALYTKSGKHDRSYQAEQLKNFFADMDGLAAKLGCVDGKTTV
jgi:hypothetical protein